MNTNKLARHYSALDPAERLSLLLAAAARDDDAEHARLMDSAPRVTWRVPHTNGRALALLVVSAIYRMECLELAALFSKALAVAVAADRKLAAQCRDVARLFGYLVKIHAQGWALFCEREHLDPTVSITAMPGEMVLEQVGVGAGLVGFSTDEALAYARRGKDPPFTLKTAESVAGALQAIYRTWVEHWE